MTVNTQNNQYSANNTYAQSSKKQETQTTFEVPQNESKTDYDKLWAMFRDIESVSRTGFTIEELENIQKLIAQLHKEISQQKEGGLTSEEIQHKIDELKKMILQMKKQVSGEAIIDMQNENGSQDTSSVKGALSTLEELNSMVESMKSGNDKKDIKSLSTIEELLLAQQLREEEKLNKK